MFLGVVLVLVCGSPVSLGPLTTGGVLPMALPPEPLQEILPQASDVVVADVVEVVSTAAAPAGGKVATQVVKLRVTRALKGQLKGEVVVTKPEGNYALKVGNTGPFVLSPGKPHPVILGRYGPDTWRVDALEAALKQP